LGRIIALDYGKKRVGVAVTDPLKITATGLKTVETRHIQEFIAEYLEKEVVDCMVVGYPTRMNYEVSEAETYIRPFIAWFSKMYPAIMIERVDERFTSQMAGKAIIEGGIKKKARRNKALVDKISAVIILQSYLESLKLKSFNNHT
jgi:putative Holliday junction resolvase